MKYLILKPGTRNVRCCTAVFLSGLVLLAGCAGSGNPHPVKVDAAADALETTMDAWKEGKTPKMMQEETPPIIVQDMEWASGAKLLEYEVLDDAQSVDANLVARVKIKVSGADGKEAEKTVTYVVGTSPKVTVFRDMMR